MSKFIPIQDAIKLLSLGNEDYLQRSKGRYLTWAKHVWQDMNLQTVKVAKREIFYINKRTNTVQLPCDNLQLSSVNVIDRHGVIYPVYRNDRLHDDIVSVESAKDCACEYKCGYQLCNTVKGYEAITSVKSDFLPNGNPISFTCVDRKAIDSNGFLYEETQYPLRTYLSGVWVDTVLHTEQKKLCNIDLDDNGCICDTEKNVNAICSTCCGHGESNDGISVGGNAMCPPSPQDDTWIYYCNTKIDWFGVQCGNYPRGLNNCNNNIYNISELGDRLIFPHNFGFDKVLIRYYADVNLNDLQIPLIALDTFLIGLKWWDARFNDKKQQLADHYQQQYSRLKFGLTMELNKYRIAELRMIVTPPTYIPSFIPNRATFEGEYYF